MKQNFIEILKLAGEHVVHFKRATPINMMKYRLCIQLFKFYNADTLNGDWIDMNIQQNFKA